MMSHKEYNQRVLQCVVAEICQAVGFDSVHSTTLDVLTDVLERYLKSISSLTHDITEQCGHTHAHVNDVRQCFRLNNISVQELIDYMQQMDEVKLTAAPKHFPFSKKSNLQFNKTPNNSDLEYVYPYLPSIVQTTDAAAKNAETTSTNTLIKTPPMSTIVGKQSDDEAMDQDTYSSDGIIDEMDANMVDDSVGDGDEPLWLKQQIKQSQKQLKKELSHNQGIAPSSVVHSSEPISPFNTNPPLQTETAKPSLWDMPMFSRPKLSIPSKTSAFAPKPEPNENISKSLKPSKSKTSITSRIEEVNRLLHDPIIEKKGSPVTSDKNTLPSKQSINSPSASVLPSKGRKMSHDSYHADEHLRDDLPFASPKSMDDAIDAVVNRATKEAEEAELMKFSHLIEDSSSSDESDIAVSHKTEEMLQLQKRGLQKPLEEESPSRPPLTPSPAPSTQSLIIDQEIDVDASPRDSSGSSPERMEISTNTISERTWSVDSPKLSYKPPSFSFEEPVKTKREQVKSKKKIKLPKKPKIKIKDKKRRTSKEKIASPKLHVSSKKDVKPVEKLILKKSKTGEAKVVKPHKEKALPMPMAHAPLPKLSALPKISAAVPKLSAAVPAPLPLPPPPKKKEKKEKKKKKDKEKEKEDRPSKKLKETREELTPIPKLTFKMASATKDVSILKVPKLKRKKSIDKKLLKKSVEPKVSAKKEVKRGLTTETISVGSKVGVIYDAQGNQIWICPGCNKPDDGSPMIGCDNCDGWYHWPCVGITKEPSKDEWYCSNCSK